MKEIQLTKGKVALVDDEYYEWLNQWKWNYLLGGYAVRHTSRITSDHRIVYMHRVILNTPEGMYTDHINHNKLDNRRCNLRICTKSQNSVNSKINKSNKSGYKGVYWFKRYRKWGAFITLQYKHIHLGYYNNRIEAANARREKSLELFGEFTNEEVV
jgi:hypothetical protein